jgi:D-alanyl-D-alanine carboxypeptidase (penicillin-binding protein 5/6)
VLADLDAGAVIAARDPHGRYQPASVQKILTTITLLPQLPGDRTVTVSRRAAQTEGSRAGLVPGGVYTVDQLFQGLLLVSGNDAAEALAEAAGGNARTVAAMNTTAQRLGAYDTFVQTPSGLDGWQQLTSAYDLTLFLRAAVAQPRFLAYDRAWRSTLPAQRVDGFAKVMLYNQNTLFLHRVRGALVAKTGFTDAAQHTFAGAIERNGHRYGVVLLRAQRWPLDQWQQATKLVDWAQRLPLGTAPVGRLDAALTSVIRSSASPSAAVAPSASPSSSPAKKVKKSPPGVGLIFALILIGAAYWITNRARHRRRRRPPDPD